MPEGDTIFRTAVSLRTWMGERTITEARARDSGLAIGRLVGSTLTDVSTHGKHLFLEFRPPVDAVTDGDAVTVVDADARSPREPDGLILRTHMMMSGSWHVYGASDRWRRPARQAVVTLVAGERLAVCFNAPVVELVPKRRSVTRTFRAGLGPDILEEPLDITEIVRRADSLGRATPVGVMLLDQHVVAGIGNIYRCESLFLERLHPSTPLARLVAGQQEHLLARVAGLMHANLSPTGSIPRSFGDGPNRPWVYGRTGRPCRRCGSRIESQKLGSQARTVYWCPTCQPAV